jgi:transcriptional regulator with XRE-family HTH domain
MRTPQEQQEGKGFKPQRLAVRRQVLSAGGTVDDVVLELRRRWDLRPRTAYRYACGWTQEEAAVRFTEIAAQLTGIRSAPMTGACISEYERWPQQGRRPSPYVLTVLAEVYGTDLVSLLDRHDIQAMPAQDQTVLDALRLAATRTGDTDARHRTSSS